MSTVSHPAIPAHLDDALYQALCAFYGSNRAVGAVEAVWDALCSQGVIVTKCDAARGTREVLELEVPS